MIIDQYNGILRFEYLTRKIDALSEFLEAEGEGKGENHEIERQQESVWMVRSAALLQPFLVAVFVAI